MPFQQELLSVDAARRDRAAKREPQETHAYSKADPRAHEKEIDDCGQLYQLACEHGLLTPIEISKSRNNEHRREKADEVGRSNHACNAATLTGEVSLTDPINQRCFLSHVDSMLYARILTEVVCRASLPSAKSTTLALILRLQLHVRYRVVGQAAPNHRQTAYENLAYLKPAKSAAKLQSLFYRGDFLG